MSAGPDLTPVLQHAQSADADLRKQAELQLQAYQQQDYAGYLVALVSELANDNKPPETRQIAGLLLKNLMDATDAVLKVAAALTLLLEATPISPLLSSFLILQSCLQEELLTRWANVDSAVKAKVKHLLLPVLGAQVCSLSGRLLLHVPCLKWFSELVTCRQRQHGIRQP